MEILLTPNIKQVRGYCVLIDATNDDPSSLKPIMDEYNYISIITPNSRTSHKS